MKIILSRKGFDSSYGGQASPIMPDKTLLSLPIPLKLDKHNFTGLKYKEKTYYDIICDLKDKPDVKEYYTCHLDPDIRADVIERDYNWKPLFGQSDSAEGHLRNRGVCEGDLFLFFGWFRDTEIINGRHQYKKDAKDLHVIYGYMEIGKKYDNYSQLPAYARYHSHAGEGKLNKKNCIYEAAERLSIDPSKPGAGNFMFNEKLVLTKNGESRSKWYLPDFFKEVKISYHSLNSFKDGYFDSAKKGQEFVIEPNNDVMVWVKKLFIE
jgi:hypothetical protein